MDVNNSSVPVSQGLSVGISPAVASSSDDTNTSGGSSALAGAIFGRGVKKTDENLVAAIPKESLSENETCIAMLSSHGACDPEITMPSHENIDKIKKLLERFDNKSEKNGLKRLAEIGLNEIQTLKDQNAQHPMSAKAACKTSVEAVAFSCMCVLAVINLLGVTKDADFSKPLEALEKLVVIPAAFCTGSMYTGGAIKLYERIEGWIKNKDAQQGSGCLNWLKEAIREQHGSMSVSDYFKVVIMTPVVVMSVVLDAKNTEVGMIGLLRDTSLKPGTISTLAKAIAVGNGTVEALLPMTTLQQLFADITKPGVMLFKGTYHTRTELVKITNEVVSLLECAINNDAESKISPKITEIIEGLSGKDRLIIEGIFKNIYHNSDQLTEELAQFILTSEVSPDYKTRLKGLAALIIELGTLTLSMWAISALVSSNQKLTFYQNQLENLDRIMMPFNASAGAMNGTMLSPGNDVALEPFPFQDDLVNLFSYSAVGAVLHPYIFKTIEMFTGMIKTLTGGCDLSRINMKRLAISLAVATIGTAGYGYVMKGAGETYQEVKDLEEQYGINTQILPDFNGLPIAATVLLLVMLFGGAYEGAKVIYDRIPKCLCDRSVKRREADDGQEWELIRIGGKAALEAPEESTGLLAGMSEGQSGASEVKRPSAALSRDGYKPLPASESNKKRDNLIFDDMGDG